MTTSQTIASAILGLALAGTSSAVIYSDGVSPKAADSNLTFGTHLLSGPHTSVAGVGGSGFSSSGSFLDGGRTYTYDFGGLTDLVAGTATRGTPSFAMMVWDMGSKFDSLRLYTHQDHYSGGPITDGFLAQDVMEYSVWGSNDGDHFTLLSDVLSYTLGGGGAGKPTYTFGGTSPSVIYRGGSYEYSTLNAYTREYVFGSKYQYYGIRASSVSINSQDADPEIDAIAAFNIKDRPKGTPGRPNTVPDAGSTLLLAAGAVTALLLSRRRLA